MQIVFVVVNYVKQGLLYLRRTRDAEADVRSSKHPTNKHISTIVVVTIYYVKSVSRDVLIFLMTRYVVNCLINVARRR